MGSVYAIDERKCKFCQEEFTLKSPKAIFCSARCQQKQWRSDHPGMTANYSKQARLRNPEKCRARNKELYWENPEKYREKTRKWLSENKEKVREKDREWKKNNASKVKKARREYYLRNLEKEHGQSRRWRKENPEKNLAKEQKRRAIKAKVEHGYVPLITELVKRQDGKCNGCQLKFSKRLKPTLDHIIPISKGGPHIESNVQALCLSCNIRKGNK